MTDQEIHRNHKNDPRFFYGYIVVIAACFIMVVSWAVYNSFGVFFKPLVAEFDWTSAVTSGAFSLSMIIYGVLGIVVGGLNDRFGPRIVVTVCGILTGIGFLLGNETLECPLRHHATGPPVILPQRGALFVCVRYSARSFSIRSSRAS